MNFLRLFSMMSYQDYRAAQFLQIHHRRSASREGWRRQARGSPAGERMNCAAFAPLNRDLARPIYLD
jgi:hypothetical protein